MNRALVGSLVLLIACAKDDVRSPAAATSTAAPSNEAPPSESAPPSSDPDARDEEASPPLEPTPAAPPSLTTITLAPEGGELAEQLATAASRARADGRVPIVEMWASWCPPCKKLDALLAKPEFAASLTGIVLVRLDSDAWGETLDEAGFDAPSIPTFYTVDAGGRPRGKPLSGAKWGKLDAESIAAKLRTLADPR
jgi:thiol-disulfide isomerase/thioredoxin